MQPRAEHHVEAEGAAVDGEEALGTAHPRYDTLLGIRVEVPTLQRCWLPAMLLRKI